MRAIWSSAAGTVNGQPAMSCVVNAIGNPLRAESLAEFTGDFFVTCTGGTPTQAGMPVPAVDIRIFLNTAITSRKLAGSWSEALLLIDEPSPVAQRICGTAGDVDRQIELHRYG